MRTESKENLVSSQNTSQNSLEVAAETGSRKSKNDFDNIPEIVLTPTGEFSRTSGFTTHLLTYISQRRDSFSPLSVVTVRPFESS